jgi:hypothetical protein
MQQPPEPSPEEQRPLAQGSVMPPDAHRAASPALAAASQPPHDSKPSPYRVSTAGLRPAGSPIASTRLGVAAPAKVSRPQPVVQPEPGGSRLWLIVGIVFALAAGVALALVIAS